VAIFSICSHKTIACVLLFSSPAVWATDADDPVPEPG
jgi:hypothetical protein